MHQNYVLGGLILLISISAVSMIGLAMKRLHAETVEILRINSTEVYPVKSIPERGDVSSNLGQATALTDNTHYIY